MGVALACWGGWVALLVWHDALPWPITVAGFALLCAWYMSLQHEVIHRHPTPWRWLNDAIGAAPLALWLPYPVYRETHLRHHDVELTVPGVDPESFYVSADEWQRASRPRRAVLWANRTLLGRTLIGPVLGPTTMIAAEIRRARHDAAVVRTWAVHLAAVLLVSSVVFVWAGVPVWMYLVGFCYLGLSVTYVRSFAEHLAVDGAAPRSAVVQSNRAVGLLFLFNNLHFTHHALPAAPWYRLPRLTQEMDSAAMAASGAGVYRGYVEIARRYGVRPFDAPTTPVHESAARP